ncbi:MAG: penicillin-binding transpeptidase domain-containing protein [Candidatus Shapirobacteria bacterium]
MAVGGVGVNEEDLQQWKYWILRGGLVLSLLILAGGSIRLLVIKGGYYKNLARDNRIFQMSIPAGRGQIIDRKGRILAKSIYEYFRKEGENRIFEASGDFLGYRFEGKDLAYDLKRQYLYGESLGLVTGYVGKISGEDIKNNECGLGFEATDLVGRGGIEEYFDCSLRGIDGKRLVEVDATGKYVRELGREEPKLGKDVALSIDAYWQEKVSKMVKGKKAAIVVSEPKTGKIIAMVSSPGFDPNVFSYNQDDETIKKYLGDSEGLPMLNRVTQARYHPGSVFKIAVATAGLETGVVDKNTLIEDTGVIKIGDYSYSNWLWTKRGGTDGMVDMITGIRRSNDIYFYRLGEKLGPEKIKIWAEKYGLGNKTGMELPGEVAGLIPDEKWKVEAKGEKWFLGNTYHMAIGQGDVDVTPLQINQMTNTIGNRGVKCKMSILKDAKTDCQSIGIKRETYETIITGMKGACKPGGTAWPLFNFKTELACKTGTAEVGDGSKDAHAWLTVLAPANDPQISITVMLERGGEGSDVAAPIAGDILKEWFEEKDTVVPRYTPTPEITR